MIGEPTGAAAIQPMTLDEFLDVIRSHDRNVQFFVDSLGLEEATRIYAAFRARYSGDVATGAELDDLVMTQRVQAFPRLSARVRRGRG